MSVPFACRIPVLLLVSVLCGLPTAAAQDRLQQELDRVNRLLQQINSSAAESKVTAQSEADDNAVAPTRLQNPFAGHKRTTPAGSGDTRSSIDSGGRPQVVVGDQGIEITLNGETIRVERPMTTDGRSTDESRPSPRASASLNTALQMLNQPSMSRAQLYTSFAQALSAFRQGQYEEAKTLLAAHESSMEQAGVVCQFYGLTLFQTGDMSRAAEWVYSGLQATAPLDWQEVQGMYADPSDYAPRYHDLQQLSQQQPERTEIRFLLAWHHLMLGHRQHAADELAVVRRSLPNDPVVQQLTQALQSQPTAPPRPLVP